MSHITPRTQHADSRPRTSEESARLAALTRRGFVTATGTAAALAVSGQLAGIASAVGQPSALPSQNVFTLGVASGDPLPDGIVLWTRLAPRPRDAFHGMPQESFEVEWEISRSSEFGPDTKKGTSTASPEWSHSVHADVRGLDPATDYWYRFRVGGQVSPVGHTRTAPLPDAQNSRLTLAVASCQAIWEGYYTAYDDMASRDLDAVLFLGDYIYEFGEDRGVRPEDGDPRNRLHCMTLDEYRDRYTLYKLDLSLQKAHAAFPWIVTFDDHEVVNNWAGVHGPGTPEDFLIRKANGFRAYFENMPLRLSQKPKGPDITLYRRLRFGTLAELSILDTRSYRSDQANGDGLKPPSAETADPSRTITGAAQEEWLLSGLGASTSRWNLLGQQTAMTRLDAVDGAESSYYMDLWDGYEASRDRVLQGIVDRGVENVVTLGGDLHRNVASNLTLDFDDPDAAPVAAEFIGTSISSGQDGEVLDESGRIMWDENPQVKFVNFQRGYNLVTMTPDALSVDHMGIDTVIEPGGTVANRKTLTVLDGIPGIQEN